MTVQQFWERNESALSAVSEKNGIYCGTIARNIIGNEQSVEEIVQDTIMKLWESIPPSRLKKLRAFIGKITRNILPDAASTAVAQKHGG